MCLLLAEIVARLRPRGTPKREWRGSSPFLFFPVLPTNRRLGAVGLLNGRPGIVPLFRSRRLPDRYLQQASCLTIDALLGRIPETDRTNPSPFPPFSIYARIGRLRRQLASFPFFFFYAHGKAAFLSTKKEATSPPVNPPPCMVRVSALPNQADDIGFPSRLNSGRLSRPLPAPVRMKNGGRSPFF